MARKSILGFLVHFFHAIALRNVIGQSSRIVDVTKLLGQVCRNGIDVLCCSAQTFGSCC